MDRTVTIFKPSGHKLAEIVFSYDERTHGKARTTQFRQLYDDNDPDDENKSVYEAWSTEDSYLPAQPLASIDEVKAFDRDYARRQLAADLPGPIEAYTFAYEAEPVLLRYFLTNYSGVVGMVEVLFSFIGGTKQLSFRSGKQFKFDMDITTDSLETNFSAMSRLMVYDEPLLPGCDLQRVDSW